MTLKAWGVCQCLEGRKACWAVIGKIATIGTRAHKSWKAGILLTIGRCSSISNDVAVENGVPTVKNHLVEHCSLYL